MKQIVLALAVSALLFGCAARNEAPPSKPPEVTEAPAQAAVEIADGTNAKAIQLRKVIVRMHVGDDVGQQKLGPFCIPRGRLSWTGGHSTGTDQDFTSAFHDELQSANYTVVGDPDALFPDASASRAEIMVGGIIDKFQLDVCYPLAGERDLLDIKGTASLHVNWEIYDVLSRKVVYEKATGGFYSAKESITGGQIAMFTNAFASAVKNLLADPGFQDAVKREPGLAAGAIPDTSFDPIQMLAAPSASSGINVASAAAVTILTATGHGSGFIVSPDGYVLTNQHVVKEAHKVRVRLATEREVIGEVLRTDSIRDVALIKLPEVNLPAISIRSSVPAVGEEVFAIGAPLSDKLDITVTRGIVSANRTDNGLKFIQSDVSIHLGSSGGPLVDKSGAVVGLCDLTIQTNGVDDNLNFFIPINEAISRLKIQFKALQASGHMQ